MANINIEYRQVSELVALPGNPRRISAADLAKLVNSIRKHGFWDHRPIAISARGNQEFVICGNQRLKAAKKIGLKKVPVVVYRELSEQEENDIIIRDNVNNGEWDFAILENDDRWANIDFGDIGLDMLAFDDKPAGNHLPEAKHSKISNSLSEDESDSDKNAFYRSMLTDCLYESDNIFDIPNLRTDMQAGKLQLPFAPYGADSRQKKDVSTYHFYVDDYRFEAIWKDPVKVLNSGCVAIVEPNLSLFDTTPIAYGLQQIYKKRWIARYFQECGIQVYADLNVSHKFYEYNQMGIPQGYNAFFTRGYADRMPLLEAEHAIACKISGNENPNLIVYGGGKAVKEYCVKHSLLYVEQLMATKKLK